MKSNILQSMISITRMNINIEEQIIDECKEGLRVLLKNSEMFKQYSTAISGHKKHLALLVRNQVELKRALRQFYFNTAYNKYCAQLAVEVINGV